MSISSKHFKIINKLIENKYSLSSQLKGKSSNELFLFGNNVNESNLFLKIEKDFESLKQDHYSICCESISSFFSIKYFEKEQNIFKEVANTFNDISSFLKPYLKNFNFKYSNLKVSLYNGSILNIDKDYEGHISFWITACFDNPSKFLKICYVTIKENELFLDFEKVSIKNFELKLNSLILSNASKKISNMQPLKNVENEKENIRENFKTAHSIKEMLEY